MKGEMLRKTNGFHNKILCTFKIQPMVLCNLNSMLNFMPKNSLTSQRILKKLNIYFMYLFIQLAYSFPLKQSVTLYNEFLFSFPIFPLRDSKNLVLP